MDRFQQLPLQRRRYLMAAMFRTDTDGWRRCHKEAEERLRELAMERGVDWGTLDDERRQDFVNKLPHEDGP